RLQPPRRQVVAKRVAGMLQELGGRRVLSDRERRWGGKECARNSGLGVRQRVHGGPERRVVELHPDAVRKPRRGEACVVAEHALGGGPVIEERAVRLQPQHAREHQREQQQAGDNTGAREVIMTFSLSSTSFQDGAAIPIKHTCDGADVSPPLAWSGAPPGTRGFALIADDPDAPAGTWVHWVLYNLPATVSDLPENI